MSTATAIVKYLSGCVADVIGVKMVDIICHWPLFRGTTADGAQLDHQSGGGLTSAAPDCAYCQPALPPAARRTLNGYAAHQPKKPTSTRARLQNVGEVTPGVAAARDSWLGGMIKLILNPRSGEQGREVGRIGSGAESAHGWPPAPAQRGHSSRGGPTLWFPDRTHAPIARFMISTANDLPAILRERHMASVEGRGGERDWPLGTLTMPPKRYYRRLCCGCVPVSVKKAVFATAVFVKDHNASTWNKPGHDSTTT